MKEKVCVATRGRSKRRDVCRNYDRLYPWRVKDREKKAVYQAVEAGGFESLNDLIETATDRIVAEVLG